MNQRLLNLKKNTQKTNQKGNSLVGGFNPFERY